MSEAEKRLETIVSDPHADTIRNTTTQLLNFVRSRTEADKRVAELDRMIVQPEIKKNFRQKLWDYTVLLSHGKLSEDPSEIGADVSSGQHQSFRTQRRADGEARSFQVAGKGIIAMAHCGVAASDVHTQELQPLLKAADAISSSSTGCLTVRYYELRLMIASGKSDAARAELDRLFKGNEPNLPLGSRNLLNEERLKPPLKLTTSLEYLLQHAPEIPCPRRLISIQARKCRPILRKTSWAHPYSIVMQPKLS